MEETKKPETSPIATFVVYVVVSLFGDFLLFPFAASTGEGGMLLTVFFVGCVIGQIGIATAMAGFGAIHWVRGFALATALSLAGGIALFLGALGSDQFFMFWSSLTLFWGICLVPVMLFVLAFPLLAMRFFTGWYLSRRVEIDLIPRYGINDFFILTAILGAVTYLAATPMRAWELDAVSYWPIVGIVALSFLVFSTIVFLPGALLSFWSKESQTTIAMQLIFSAAVIVALFIFGSITTGGFAGGGEEAGVIFALGSGGCLSFFLGTHALRGCDIHFANPFSPAKATVLATENEKNDQPESAEVANEPSPWDEPEPAKPAQVLPFWDSLTGTRLCAASICLVAILGSFASWGLDSYRENRIAAINELGGLPGLQGGSIRVGQYDIQSVNFGPDATNDDVKKFLDFEYLNRIDLSDSQVDDSVVQTLTQFPSLGYLDISNTDVTVNGIQELMKQTELYGLRIAGIEFPKGEIPDCLFDSLSELDISNCGVSYTELKKHWSELPNRLGIGGMNLNDDQLTQLLFDSAKDQLDLHNNNLDGSFLAKSRVPIRNINLSMNPLVDNSFKEAANASLDVYYLTLGQNPKLTSKGLDDLLVMGVQYLELGPGCFTEKQLSAAQLQISELILRGKEFTGAELDLTAASLYELDLSHTGVTSESFNKLKGRLGPVSVLVLKGTAIDDDALPMLVGMGVFRLDLSNTQVTAAGLRQFQSEMNGTLIITPGQFSTEELSELRRTPNIQLGSDEGGWF